MSDRPYLRLASFAALLVMVFGVALLAGRQFGPNMKSDTSPTHDAMRASQGGQS